MREGKAEEHSRRKEDGEGKERPIVNIYIARR